MTRDPLPWHEVLPVPAKLDGIDDVLASVDTLRKAWDDFLKGVDEAAFKAGRERSLRRHAIETGIIERLYEADWGVTEALVAEGLSLEVATREGGITDDALATINTQFDALKFLADYARDGMPLTVFFVRQLHQALTRNQLTYDAHNSLGDPVKAPLKHGDWKTAPNHVRRPDGSLLEYTPPERVQDQMEELVRLYHSAGGEHPLIRAAWVHHAFICIHPFEDGNGRVARALSLLVLLQANYAPLVVDRNNRESYIQALDTANLGELSPLARLFARLEIVALRSELETPAPVLPLGGDAVDVANAYVDRLRLQIKATDENRKALVAGLATEAVARANSLLVDRGRQLRDAFRAVDPGASHSVTSATPPGNESNYWRTQIIRSAKEAGFFSNFVEGTWWTRLHLTALGATLRYAVVIQKVGHGETGVLASTVFAETVRFAGENEDKILPSPAIRMSGLDSVTLVHSDQLEHRWPEIADTIERTLTAAIANFASELG